MSTFAIRAMNSKVVRGSDWAVVSNSVKAINDYGWSIQYREMGTYGGRYWRLQYEMVVNNRGRYWRLQSHEVTDTVAWIPAQRNYSTQPSSPSSPLLPPSLWPAPPQPGVLAYGGFPAVAAYGVPAVRVIG